MRPFAGGERGGAVRAQREAARTDGGLVPVAFKFCFHVLLLSCSFKFCFQLLLSSFAFKFFFQALLSSFEFK